MTERRTDASRRDFLKLAGAAAPAAVAAVAVSSEADAAAVEKDAGEGLRMTPHTEAYYKSARF